MHTLGEVVWLKECGPPAYTSSINQHSREQAVIISVPDKGKHVTQTYHVQILGEDHEVIVTEHQIEEA